MHNDKLEYQVKSSTTLPNCKEQAKKYKTHKMHNAIAFLFLQKNLTGAELFRYFDLI